MTSHTSLIALALLASTSASGAALDVKNETSLSEVDRTHDSVYLAAPSTADTLPRAGSPRAPVSSTSAELTLSETDSGRCATFGVPHRDLVHVTILDPDRKLYSGDITIYDLKGSTSTDTIHQESDDLDDPPLVPFLLLNGAEQDITLCADKGSSEVAVRMRSVLPNSTLAASLTGSAVAGEDVRVEARLAGIGLRDAPLPVSITVTSDDTTTTLYDVGTSGDVEAGDGIYTTILTAPKDSAVMNITVQAEALEGDLTIFRTAHISTAVFSDGGGIDRSGVMATDDYIRVPLESSAEEGGRIQAFFGIGDSQLSTMSVRIGKDDSGFVAFVPRWGGSEDADRVVLRYIPADPSEATDQAAFKLP